MKKISKPEEGSVLMMALLTITFLSLICATSLYITSQNVNATAQTTSWQQALSGAEAGVDQAMNALNRAAAHDSTAWSGWSKVTASALPVAQPSPSPSATAFPSPTSAPGNGAYNYYSLSYPLTGEASNQVDTWVTIDNGSLTPNTSGLTWSGAQAYRIRSYGVVGAPGPGRVSNNRLDDQLRKISLRYNRFTGASISTPVAVRRLELVAKPALLSSSWDRGITLAHEMTMSGGSSAYTDIAIGDSTSSDLKNMYVYGSIQYSGPSIKGTTNVQGNISTPYAGTFTPTVNPNVSSWGTTNNLQQYTSSEQTGLPAFTGGNYTNYSGASTITASGSASSPTYVKVSGDFIVSGGGTFTIDSSSGGSGAAKYLVIWVTGKLTISGGSSIIQNNNTYVTWIIDNDITFSGGSYNNQTLSAKNFEMIGVGSHKTTISGSSTFNGSIYAPGHDVTISGSGNFNGAILADTLNISGTGQFGFDTSLGVAGNIKNYSYASWFEDNSDPARGIRY